MRSVLVINHVPPASSHVGARRVQALCEYLRMADWSVQLLTLGPDGAAMLTEDFFPEPSVDTVAVAQAPWMRSPVWRSTTRLRTSLLDRPDSPRFRAWRSGASQVLSQVEPPSLLVSSAPLWSTHGVAARASQAWDIPWVPDYRDLWSNSAYNQHYRWRRRIDRVWEVETVRHAAAYTASTPAMVAALRSVMPPVPGRTIVNGYDSKELKAAQPLDLGPGFHVTHAGVLYGSKRNADPVLSAMAADPRLADMRLHLLGEADEARTRLRCSELGISDRVIMPGRLSHARTLSYLRGSDVALLLRWDSPADGASIPAKVFEYIGLQLPILCLGYKGGVLAPVLDTYGHYRHARNEPADVAEALIALRSRQADPGLTQNVQAFDRIVQLRRWEAFLAASAR